MWWYIAGFFSFPVVLILGSLLIEAITTAFAWLYTKRQEMKARITKATND